MAWCSLGNKLAEVEMGVAIVVAGHDKYSGAWPAMMHGLEKYALLSWPIYWITNHLDAPDGCKTVRVGGDFNPKKWSDRMIRGLKQVPAKTILWMLDDHWITAKPNIGALVDFSMLVGWGYIDRLRLYPGLDHDFGKPYSDSRLIIMDKKSPYRCSCKPSFWDHEVLLGLLREGESPWDFEKNGRGRSEKYKFAVTKDWYFYFVTRGCPDGGKWPKSPLVKGKLTVSAKRYYEREGLKFNLKHPVKGNPFGKEKPFYILP